MLNFLPSAEGLSKILIQHFFKWTFRPLFCLFRLFKQTLKIVQQLNVKNVHPVFEPTTLEHESPTITTRQQLPPLLVILETRIH